jgi:glycosyltransferase involved in cell wall biosynthesis
VRILQVHNFYRTRGGECGVVCAERKLLVDNGHEVIPFYADSKDIDSLSTVRKAEMFLQIPHNVAVARRFRVILESARPDLVHIHNVFPLLSPSIYRVAKHLRYPVIQTLHNYRFLCPNGLFYVKGKICEACQEKGYWEAVRNRCMHGSIATSALYAAAVMRGWHSGAFGSCIDRFIVLNKFSAGKIMTGGVPKEKIHICGNFVNDFAEAPATKKRYALYLGRLSSEKGLATLLAAARLVPELPLKIAGTGPLEADLRRAVGEPGMNYVELVGHVTGEVKRRFIAEALCTIVPSECHENFPLSLVESLALGTPVIASRMGGLPDLIEHGCTGLLFQAGDAEALAECLRRISDSEAGTYEMAVNALARARERFTPQRHLEQLLEIYRDAIGDARKISNTHEQCVQP